MKRLTLLIALSLLPVLASAVTPSVPTNMKAVANADGTITVSWTNPSDGQGTNLYMATSDAALSAQANTVNGGTPIAGGANGTPPLFNPVSSYTVTGLTPGVKYFFDAGRWDCSAGCLESAFSAHVSATAGAPAPKVCITNIQNNATNCVNSVNSSGQTVVTCGQIVETITPVSGCP
jgi:hypothetical protein